MTKDPITISSDDWTQVSSTGFVMDNETDYEIRYRFNPTKPDINSKLGIEMLQNGGVNNNIVQNCWMRLITSTGITATVLITEF